MREKFKFVGLDLDGVILDFRDTLTLGVRPDLEKIVRGLLGSPRMAAILTNQGRLPFGITRGRPYHTPGTFLARLWVAVEALARLGVDVVRIGVCVYHPHAPVEAMLAAAEETRDGLVSMGFPEPLGMVVAHYAWRKPEPAMIRWAGVPAYAGDDPDTDGEAARRAGVPFIWVPRWEVACVDNYCRMGRAQPARPVL